MTICSRCIILCLLILEFYGVFVLKENHYNRDLQIDVIKSVAIWFVLAIHVCFFTDPVGSAQFTSALLWRVFVGSAVPLFLMCSGALMLRAEKELTLKRLFSHNLLRIVIAMLFWATVYKIMDLVQTSFTLPGLLEGAKKILTFQQEFHLYYIHMMILVYLLLPLTRLFVKTADERLLRYALVFWFVFGIVYPTVKPFWPLTLITGIPAQWMVNMAYSAVGYTLLGWYLRSHMLSERSALCLFGAGFVFTFALTYFFSVKQGSLNPQFLEGMTVGPCLMAIGLYGLLLHVRPGGRSAPIVVALSRGSFCVYLVHVFFQKLDKGTIYPILSMPRAILIPMAASVLLILSMMVYAVLSRIPVVKRWLV